MDYLKAFESIKNTLEKAEISLGEEHFAIQLRLSDDDCAGILYVEVKDKQLFVEPYDYYDNDVDVLSNLKDIKAIFGRRLNVQNSIDSGRIIVTGNVTGFIDFVNSIKVKPAAKKAPTKPAVKKATPEKAAKPAPKTVSKAVKKKAEAQVMPDNKNKADTTKNKPISTVVEKEIKPEKKTKK